MSTQRHIYDYTGCECERCQNDRARAKATGSGWILAAISALEIAQKNYPSSTREWRACSEAMRPLHRYMASVSKCES